MSDDSPIIGRLAPSPTGRLHVGHARSFLLAWWHLRSRGGRVLLRIEDLDRQRVKPGLVEGVLEDLRWLGLDWDGEVQLQSEGVAHLEAATRELSAKGLTYPCVCTRREIQLAASAPHPGEAGPPYPGTCRGRYASIEEAEAASGRKAALRFLAPDREVEVQDLLHGRFTSNVAREAGDFPITSRDGQVAYQLAVVVDDARSGVTEVLRGEDLLASCPRQALLLDALGLPRPTWIHVPLVVDDAGERLAKRHDALSLAELRESGANPEEFVAWIARSAGQEAPQPGLAPTFTPGFDLSKLSPEPLRFGSRERATLIRGR